eukprot:TRINITY_DN2832_c0_g2_i3.p1 TRINITY_DN2832_c0_g2~~TRINITY_DN2832_c0_g2_i3.p1  ORF type:complete len:349 (-),score=113.98 TRINITY_DN2832_c0_g2_i3:128-1174(-)
MKKTSNSNKTVTSVRKGDEKIEKPKIGVRLGIEESDESDSEEEEEEEVAININKNKKIDSSINNKPTRNTNTQESQKEAAVVKKVEIESEQEDKEVVEVAINKATRKVEIDTQDSEEEEVVEVAINKTNNKAIEKIGINKESQEAVVEVAINKSNIARKPIKKVAIETEKEAGTQPKKVETPVIEVKSVAYTPIPPVKTEIVPKTIAVEKIEEKSEKKKSKKAKKSLSLFTSATSFSRNWESSYTLEERISVLERVDLKKSKKVFGGISEVETLEALLQVFTSNGFVKEHSTLCLKALRGIGQGERFGLLKMMFNDSILNDLKTIFAVLKACDVDSKMFSRVTSKYGF